MRFFLYFLCDSINASSKPFAVLIQENEIEFLENEIEFQENGIEIQEKEIEFLENEIIYMY